MRPFQQFRLWARRAPTGERLAALVVAIVFAAGVILAIPSDDDAPRTGADAGALATGGGPTAGGVGESAPGAAAGTEDGGDGGQVAAQTLTGNTDGASSGLSAAGTSASAGGGCVSPPGSDQGITDKEIKIALFLVELAGETGNAAFNVPPAREQRRAYEAIVDEINRTGGVACRQLKVLYFTINPVDQAQLRQTCLDVVEAKVFYALDLGGYAAFPAIADCYVQNQIPFYEGNFIPQSQVEKGYPYMFAASTQDNLFFNAVFGLKEKGFYDPARGFKKLGYIYRECIPEHSKKVLAWLQQAGVPSAQIVQYNLGCPVGLYASPSDIAQAVLRFQQNGVSHVLTHGSSDWFAFSRVAQQQRYKPRYGVTDQSTSFSSYGTNGPDWNNIDGSLLISNYRFNEERTPGLKPTAGTERCRRIMAPRGQKHMYEQQIGMSGVACNQLWFFESAVNHAPELKRTALADGLRRGGPIDFSYPYGPATFPTPRSTYHGNFWWTQIAHADCSCWTIGDPTFRPTFAGFS